MPAVPTALATKPASTGMFGRVREFTREVSGELAKATWPWDNREKGVKKYRELTDSTIVVVVAMLLLGGFVAFWDLILSSILGLLAR